MTKRFPVLAFILTLCFSIIARAESLTGQVVNKSGQALPGLTVSLVHPKSGRSYPVVTDRRGRFIFRYVPRISDPYYLEIYSGKRLLYRKKLIVRGDQNLSNIRL